MSNVQRLAEVGLVHPGYLTPEQRDIIENQMTNEEIDSLLSVQQKLGGVGSMHGTEVCPTCAVF